MSKQLPQVTLYLHWLQYLYAVTAGDKVYTWFNMDETALPLFVTSQAGNVLRAGRRQKSPFHQRAGLQVRRGHITAIATICDDPDLQPHLPQLLLPNAKGRKAFWKNNAVLKAAMPHIRCIEDTGGWMNIATMRSYLRLLREAVRTHRPHTHIVLIMDCHMAHIALPVLREARKAGILILLIPSRLTYMLQPLDVAVFAPFKAKLRQMHIEARLRSEEGACTLQSWLPPTVECVRSFFGSWKNVEIFKRLGQQRTFAYLDPCIRGLAAPTWQLSHRALTQEEVHSYIGVKRSWTRRLLFPIVPKPPVAVASGSFQGYKRLRSKVDPSDAPLR